LFDEWGTVARYDRVIIEPDYTESETRDAAEITTKEGTVSQNNNPENTCRQLSPQKERRAHQLAMTTCAKGLY
jgi:hypothetical protein